MNKVWANRLIAGTQSWKDVPDKRREEVLTELKSRVESGKISQEQLNSILGSEQEE